MINKVLWRALFSMPSEKDYEAVAGASDYVHSKFEADQYHEITFEEFRSAGADAYAHLMAAEEDRPDDTQSDEYGAWSEHVDSIESELRFLCDCASDAAMKDGMYPELVLFPLSQAIIEEFEWCVARSAALPEGQGKEWASRASIMKASLQNIKDVYAAYAGVAPTCTAH
jgi:hypothetical protein